jgi:hypothetical protein
VTFWLGGVFMFSILWARDEWGGRLLGTLIGSALVYVSIRLLFNAILKPKKIREGETRSDE